VTAPPHTPALALVPPADETRRDPVTLLPNRQEALEHLSSALARIDPERGSIGVLVVDLDRFRSVNRERGAHVGDQVLFSAARRIMSAARACDMVARVGADEFLIVCVGLERTVEVAALAEGVLAAFDDPFALGEEIIAVTASVGVAVADGSEAGAESLIDDAQAALERSPRGTRRLELFDPALRARIRDRARLGEQLEVALRADRLTLAYQPIVDIATGRVAAVEALARWRHPERGPVSPELFVSIADETGRSDALLDRVLDRAARDFPSIAALDRTGLLQLAFNVSAQQLISDSLIPAIERFLERTWLDPARAVVEVSESALSGPPEEYARHFAKIRSLGVRLSLDDFGTASTSISQLRSLPVDQIKLDRSFVGGLAEGSADAALAAGLLPMARALGVEVVAEGIETDQQLAHLFALGYRWGQGYRFAVPESATRVASLVSAGPLPAANDPAAAWGPENERFRQALLGGDAKGAERVIEEAVAAGVGAMAIQTEIIGRALHWIDSEWEAGRLDAADQHLAAAICERQLNSVLDALRPEGGRFARRVLLARIDGSEDTAELRWAADQIGSAGYETVYMGTGVRGDALAAASGTHHAGAVCLEAGAGGELADVVARLEGVEDPPLVIAHGGEGSSAGRAIRIDSTADALDVLARELEAS
jgi:diguanylate cyclase (GGDEF)-like protein